MSVSAWAWIGGSNNPDSLSNQAVVSRPGNVLRVAQAGNTATNFGSLISYDLIAASPFGNDIFVADTPDAFPAAMWLLKAGTGDFA